MNNIIEQNKAKVSKNRDLYEKSEAAVRTHLIEPVLNQLGWTTSHPDFVVPNFRTDENDEPDYTLRTNDKDIAYIEAKKISPKLKENIGQLARYCTNQGKQYGILTDGMKWILFKAFEVDKKLYDRIIWEIDFEKDRTTEIEARLNTISFNNFPNLKELTDKLDKLDKAWDNVANNPTKLKNAIIEIIKLDLENMGHNFETNEIENFVSDKLQGCNKLFHSVDNSSDPSFTHSQTTTSSKIRSEDKTKVTFKDFTHKGNGIYSYNIKPSIRIDISNISIHQMEEQLEQYGLYTANGGSLYHQFRNKSGVIRRRK